MFLDQYAQTAHALGHIAFIHRECLGDCLAGGSNVIGIDDDGVVQLTRSSGEAAEDEYATLIVPRSDEFLCHQIHSIVQGGDHAEMGGAVVALYLVAIVLAIEKDDRSPPTAFKARIDPVGLSFDF